MTYGIPYKGSKQKLISKLAPYFPHADHFYDLFGGGGSVTHWMMENLPTAYQQFHYNEIKPHVVDCFKRAATGEFNYNVFQPPWVTREEFFAKKDTDGYVLSCWSFGNGGNSYLFSKQIEPYKRSMHQAVVFGEFDSLSSEVLQLDSWPDSLSSVKSRRLYLRHTIEKYRKTTIPQVLHQFLPSKQLHQLHQLQQLEQLQQLQQLERLEQLHQLQQLERLEQLTITSKDYREVEIYQNAVVYCDIPYKNTRGYGAEFSHDEFFDWAASQSYPVFISEYLVNDIRFKCVAEIEHKTTISRSKGGESLNSTVEKLYWNCK